MNEWIEFLMILLILGCAISWAIIGIGILICRMKGKCPKARICKDSKCRWGIWCTKHQRYADKEKYLFEQLREYTINAKKKNMR